jgi:septal ring factor EnvC (AmiA/AmiB activator)
MKRLILSLSILFTLSGCLPALFGEDTKAAEQAFGTCKHDAALEAVERALATSTDGDEIYHALALKAAVLKDTGQAQASQALHPTILLIAKVLDGKPLSQDSMERDINQHILNAQRIREENAELAAEGRRLTGQIAVLEKRRAGLRENMAAAEAEVKETVGWSSLSVMVAV